MRRHLVEQQHRRRAEIRRHRPGVRQDERDQQRLLLAGRAEPGRHPLGGVDRRQVVAVRPARLRPAARSRPRPPLSAAASPARSRGPSASSASSARGNSPASAAASRASAARRLRVQPRPELGHPRLQRLEPADVAHLVAQQPVALAQRPRRSRSPPRRGPGRGCSVSRSRKRRRSAGASINSRSIAGVSQSTRATPPSAACVAALPSISTGRPAASDRVATSCAPSGAASSAATFQPIRPGARASSSLAAPRSPRPGDSSDTASIRLVLPAPFGPGPPPAGRRAQASPRGRIGNAPAAAE